MTILEAMASMKVVQRSRIIRAAAQYLAGCKDTAALQARVDCPRRMAEIYNQSVLVVGPPEEVPVDADDIDALLTHSLSRMSVRDTVATIAAATGAPRKEIYRRALELSRDIDPDGQ